MAEYILENKGIEVDPYSIYDVQVKRAHLYKRQLLLTLYIIYLYDRIRRNPGECGLYPRTFILGGKAAASYYMAKLSIKLINSVADVINHDPSVNDIIKVVPRNDIFGIHTIHRDGAEKQRTCNIYNRQCMLHGTKVQINLHICKKSSNFVPF